MGGFLFGKLAKKTRIVLSKNPKIVGYKNGVPIISSDSIKKIGYKKPLHTTTKLKGVSKSPRNLRNLLLFFLF